MKHRYHTLLLALAIVTALTVAGVYAYMQYAVSASVARTALARDIVKAEEANKGHEAELRALYEESAADRARLPGFFVPSAHAVDFIEALEEIGRAAGSSISISAIEADALDKAAPGTVGSVTAAVSAQGTWAAVMKTLILAEDLPYAASVSHVRIEADLGAGSTKQSAWRLSFTIQAALMAGTPPVESGPGAVVR